MLVSRYLRLILKDICTQSCLHHFLLEFLGTALFLSASLSAVLMLPLAAGKPGRDLMSAGNQSDLSHPAPPLSPVSPAGPFQVALVFGLSIAMAAVSVGGDVHINPSVTIAMALTLRLRLWRAALYVIGQLLGGVASASLLLGLSRDLTPVLNQVSFMQNMMNSQSVSRMASSFSFQVSSGVHLHQAVALETLATLQLVLVVLATVSIPLPGMASPLLIGLAVSLGHLVAVSFVCF